MFEEDFKHRHLWKYLVADETAERVTEGEFSVLNYSVSRDGERIAFHRAPSPVLESRDLSEVWLMSANGANAHRVTDNEVPERNAQVSPDGTQVLFLARTNERFEKYYNGNMSQALPVALRPGESCLDPFPDTTAFKLRQRRQDVQLQLPGWRREVNPFPQRHGTPHRGLEARPGASRDA